MRGHEAARATDEGRNPHATRTAMSPCPYFQNPLVLELHTFTLMGMVVASSVSGPARTNIAYLKALFV